MDYRFLWIDYTRGYHEDDDSQGAAAATSTRLFSKAIDYFRDWIPQTDAYSLGAYVFIESTWHIALFAVCYRYRPLYQLSQKSAYGRRLVQKLSRQADQYNRSSVSSSSSASSLTKNPASTRQSIITVSSRIPWRPSYRTAVAASEWFLCNKMIGIPLFPSKLVLAGIWGEQLRRQATKE